jgi:murein L,D-transpeptidase YcbB/YkuD
MAPMPPVIAVRRTLAVLLLLAVAALGIGPAAARDFSPRELAAVRLNIIDVLTGDSSLPLPVRQRRDELLAYYAEAAGQLLWLGSDRAESFLARLRAANEDGLDPSAYPADRLGLLMAAAGDGDTRALSIVELHFSAAFVEYASDIRVGRFLPHKVDPNFFAQARTIDLRTALRTLATAPSIDAFFDGWQPQAKEYAALKAILAEYRQIAEEGGWPKVPLGETLKPGMSDERVPQLRARLAVTDGASPSASQEAAPLYDEALAKALKAFQARHGLDVDGAVGPATIAALNAPVEDRIEEIAAAMERWRWWSASPITARLPSATRSSTSSSIPTGTCRAASR